MKRMVKVNWISFMFLLICILCICVIGKSYLLRKENMLLNIKINDYNYSNLSTYKLLYGEWEIVEHLGGGFRESYSEEEDQNSEGIGQHITIHPKYLQVDDVKSEGNVIINVRLIPEEFISALTDIFRYPESRYKEKELKCEDSDYYTIADILLTDELRPTWDESSLELRFLYVKDKNTIMIATANGYYKMTRISHIDGLDEKKDIMQILQRVSEL